MAPERYLLASATALKPRRQGSLDYLCGLYAIINALRLAIHPTRLTASDEGVLFTAGIMRLAKHWDVGWAVHYGLTNAALFDVATRLARLTGKLSGVDVTIDRAAKRIADDDRAAWLTAQLSSGHPVLSEYGPIDHFSVCVGWDDVAWRLFDSSGRRSVATVPDGRMVAFRKPK